MKRGLRIKEVAYERGFTLKDIAEKLHIHLSNLSAIASGRRGVSLSVLESLSRILDCSIDELLNVDNPAVFKDKRLQRFLEEREKGAIDGQDKTWVDRLMLLRNAHYRASRRLK